ncbi:MAG: S-layer homology domain-containing protein [Coprothermobacterota bacterium]|nr:S-layer homology domain-containing protein [Coprothermobacterota bacterium]
MTELKTGRVYAQSTGLGTTFPDIPKDHWASVHIEGAVANGLVEGYPNGGF